VALSEIVERKRMDVARRQAENPQPSWVRSDRPWQPAGTAFILECKRASPSEGVLRADLDVLSVAAAYRPLATAISVLTDGPYFNGSFEDLKRVRGVVPQPVLCKDFVVTPWQVYEARSQGADMILLMLSVLRDEEWRACFEAVQACAMTALTEVHDKEELERASRLGAQLLGINNRNLKTLEVDVSVSERLVSSAGFAACRISESGLSKHAQVRKLRSMGFDGFLVGSAMMKSPRLDLAVRRLIFGEVKVCGLRRRVDAEAAWASWATWGGLIMAPGSPRRVTLEEARRVRTDELSWVGVFVDAAISEVVRAVGELGLSAVQLHGSEDDAYRSALREHVDCEIWQAYRVRDSLPLEVPAGADKLLLDTYKPGVPGGTGATWDWGLLSRCAYRDRVVVSGGLTPAMASQADACDVWALDVNSGVESAPGIKDPEKLSAFFASLRG
jgi:indole-3-glycerol phosphate synthase/phosphoribosylanthranilate isomerase